MGRHSYNGRLPESRKRNMTRARERIGGNYRKTSKNHFKQIKKVPGETQEVHVLTFNLKEKLENLAHS